MGTVRVRAHVTDKAGNERTSSAQTVVVSSSGISWTITDALVTTNAMVGTGPLQNGNLNLLHLLDLDRSPGTNVGGSPALAYNSERVDVRPVVQASVPRPHPLQGHRVCTAAFQFLEIKPA